MKFSSISVIIPVYNSKDTLKACLASLNNQTLRPGEIILVNDGSTDESVKTIKNLQKKLPNIKFFTQIHQGPATARNLGASKAKEKILVFVDSDMEFDQDFLFRLTLPVRKGIAKGSWSGHEFVKNWQNPWARSWNYDLGLKTKIRVKLQEKPPKVFRSILKSEFDKVKGFDAIGYTDDWTLSSKLGYFPKITRAKFYHHNPDTLKKVFTQAKWIGQRQYKLNKIGNLVAILRSNFLFSLFIGLYKSILFFEPKFIVFKLVYDFGIMTGAVKSLSNQRY